MNEESRATLIRDLTNLLDVGRDNKYLLVITPLQTLDWLVVVPEAGMLRLLYYQVGRRDVGRVWRFWLCGLRNRLSPRFRRWGRQLVHRVSLGSDPTDTVYVAQSLICSLLWRFSSLRTKRVDLCIHGRAGESVSIDRSARAGWIKTCTQSCCGRRSVIAREGASHPITEGSVAGHLFPNRRTPDCRCQLDKMRCSALSRLKCAITSYSVEESRQVAKPSSDLRVSRRIPTPLRSA